MTVNARSLGVMAGTVAAGGVCPVTGRRCVRQDCVDACIALMYTCGMYNYSGSCRAPGYDVTQFVQASLRLWSGCRPRAA